MLKAERVSSVDFLKLMVLKKHKSLKKKSTYSNQNKVDRGGCRTTTPNL